MCRQETCHSHQDARPILSMVGKRKSICRGHDGCYDCPDRRFRDWYRADREFASLDERCGPTYPKNLEIQTCYVRDGTDRLRYTSRCEVWRALIHLSDEC